MAVRLLKSLTTGVVLPYNPAALKSANVREMTAQEVAEYMGTLDQKAEAPQPVAEPEPVFEEPAPEIETGVVVTQDYSEGEPDADEVLKALEVD